MCRPLASVPDVFIFVPIVRQRFEARQQSRCCRLGRSALNPSPVTLLTAHDVDSDAVAYRLARIDDHLFSGRKPGLDPRVGRGASAELDLALDRTTVGDDEDRPASSSTEQAPDRHCQRIGAKTFRPIVGHRRRKRRCARCAGTDARAQRPAPPGDQQHRPSNRHRGTGRLIVGTGPATRFDCRCDLCRAGQRKCNTSTALSAFSAKNGN